MISIRTFSKNTESEIDFSRGFHPGIMWFKKGKAMRNAIVSCLIFLYFGTLHV
jgi:hypothetical protein